MKTPLLIALVLVVAVAGLGGAAATHGSATVSTGTSKLDRILVDGRGRTLYLFEKDAARRGACAAPAPLLAAAPRCAPKPTAGARRGSCSGRHDPPQQRRRLTTYAGHRLGRFGAGRQGGQTNVQGLRDFEAGSLRAAAGTKIKSNR